MDTWIILLIWFSMITLTTCVQSYYIRTRGRADVVIAMYVFYLSLSQILAAKIADFGLGITAPTAVLIFPFTFQLTDTMNEHFGQKETHRMIFIAFIIQFLLVVFIWFSVTLTPSEFWNNLSGFTNKQAYWDVFFNQSIRITIASFTSYLITENLDAILFARIRKITGEKRLWVRNVLSDIPTLALDSLLFVWLAFGGEQPDVVVWGIVYGQLLTKWFFGLIDTPFIYLERWIIHTDKLRFLKAEIQGSNQPKAVA